MPRYAPAMTEQDLRLVITQKILENPNEYNDEIDPEDFDGLLVEQTMMPGPAFNKVEKDWAKVSFDCENVEFNGFHMTTGGTPIAMLTCGGDWEFPIEACVYFDGKDLRGYIPKNGNIYNYVTKAAFGNCDDDDDDADTRGDTAVSKKYFGCDWRDIEDSDLEKIYQDIDGRIETRGTYTPKTTLKTGVKKKSKPRETPAEKLAKRQQEAERVLDLTNITPDMVQAFCETAFDNSSSVTFYLKASSRQLTRLENQNLSGVPKELTLADWANCWFSKESQAATLKRLSLAGFDIQPYFNGSQTYKIIII